MTLLAIKQVNKSYNHIPVLSDINLSIGNKEIIGLIGENGSGKSTLMKIICGLNEVDSGRVLFNGRQDEIGVLIEQPALYPHLNAIENLIFYGKALKVSNLEKNITNLLNLVGLMNERKKTVSNYSLGMKQRLGLAISLINKPRLLILDEPINGLDPKGIKELREVLLGLIQQPNFSMIISSHILSELEMIASKICFIKEGKIIDFKTIEQLSEYDKTKIILETPQVKLAIKVIKENFGVEGKIISAEKFAIYKEEASLEKILTVLIEKKIKVLDVSTTNTSLEEYFLKLGGN